MPLAMLISLHRDGRMIAQVIAHFGQRTVVGSTSRGGTAALRAILRALSGGTVIGFILGEGRKAARRHAPPIAPAAAAAAG